jgi:DNA-binding FadR family transcriptional regulator
MDSPMMPGTTGPVRMPILQLQHEALLLAMRSTTARMASATSRDHGDMVVTRCRQATRQFG